MCPRRVSAFIDESDYYHPITALGSEVLFASRGSGLLPAAVGPA